MKRSRVVAVSLVMCLLGTGCFGSKHRDPTTLQVTKISGDVIARASATKPFAALTEGVLVDIGTEIRVQPGGDVTIARGDTSSVELRPSASDATASARIQSIDVVDLTAGDVLITTDPNAPLSVSSQGTSARTEAKATFRLDRRLRVRVGTYDGDVAVAIDSGPLPSLQTLDEWLVNPRVAPVLRPYSLDPTDPWDRRLLGDAIEVQDGLGFLSDFEGRFGSRLKGLAVLDPMAKDSGRSIAFVAPYVANTTSSDILVGLVFALVLERAHIGSAERLFSEMIARRKQGAAWGLIAHEHQLTATAALQPVTCAYSLLVGEKKPGEGCFRVKTPPVPSTAPTQTTTTPPTSGPTTSPSGKPSTHPSPSVTPTTSHSPSPSPTPSHSVSPSPTPSCSALDQLLGNC